MTGLTKDEVSEAVQAALKQRDLDAAALTKKKKVIEDMQSFILFCTFVACFGMPPLLGLSLGTGIKVGLAIFVLGVVVALVHRAQAEKSLTL